MMRGNTLIGRALVLVCAALVGCGPPPPPTYEVKFERPHAVGQRYRQLSQGRETLLQELARGNLSTNLNRELTWNYEAEVEVVAVDERRWPTRLLVEVTRLTGVESGRTNELVTAGMRVRAHRDERGKIQVEPENGELSEIAARILRHLAEVPDPEIDRDRIYAPTRAVPVGQRWPMRAELLASDMYNPARRMDIKQATGSVQLVSLVRRLDMDCLQLEAEFVGDPVELVVSERLPALTGTMKLNLVTYLPTNGLPLPVETEMTISATAAFSGNLSDRIPLKFEARGETWVHTRLQPLASADETP